MARRKSRIPKRKRGTRRTTRKSRKSRKQTKPKKRTNFSMRRRKPRKLSTKPKYPTMSPRQQKFEDFRKEQVIKKIISLMDIYYLPRLNEVQKEMYPEAAIPFRLAMMQN